MVFQTPESLAAGLLGGITAPIFNRKRIRAEFNRSVAERAEAFYNYQQTIITGYGEVVNNIQGDLLKIDVLSDNFKFIINSK